MKYAIGLPMLNGNNFLDWKEAVLFNLGVMDLDLCFRIPKPTETTSETEDFEVEEFALWEKSNRLAMKYMIQHVPREFRGPYIDQTLVADYLMQMEGQFASADKAKGGSLIQNFANTRYDGKGNIREHIMFMRDISGKLQELDMIIHESFLVHFIMQTLPS